MGSLYMYVYIIHIYIGMGSLSVKSNLHADVSCWIEVSA
jgi:hypothetical protein